MILLFFFFQNFSHFVYVCDVCLIKKYLIIKRPETKAMNKVSDFLGILYIFIFIARLDSIFAKLC